MYLLTCAPNENSHLPVHLCSLVYPHCSHEETASLAIKNASSEDFDQTVQMHRLIRFFTGCTCSKGHFLILLLPWCGYWLEILEWATSYEYPHVLLQNKIFFSTFWLNKKKKKSNLSGAMNHMTNIWTWQYTSQKILDSTNHDFIYLHQCRE